MPQWHISLLTLHALRLPKPCPQRKRKVFDPKALEFPKELEMYRISPFVQRYAYALLIGATLATLWVNFSPMSYYDMKEWRLADITMPNLLWGGSVTLTPWMIVSDIFMALFFFYLGKELWEAVILERGNLSGRAILLPLGLALGAMAGGALAWQILSAFFETAQEVIYSKGWAVPLGGGTIFVYFFAKNLFAKRSRLLHLALLIAILMDILSLLALGLEHFTLSWRLLWLLLPLLAAFGVGHLHGQQSRPAKTERERRAKRALWPYLLAGALSWFGVAASGLPAALGLLPILPAVRHADRSFGIFAEAEGFLHDPLNRLVHQISWPLVGVLFMFGLLQGGLDLQAFAPTTWITLASFWIGKPLGLALAGGFMYLIGLGYPQKLRLGPVLGVLALSSIGFTASTIAIGAALPGGAMQEAARLGLAMTLLAGPITLLVARTIFTKPIKNK